jgi:hypothetical protein
MSHKYKGCTVFASRGVLGLPRYVLWRGRNFVRIVQPKFQHFAELVIDWRNNQTLRDMYTDS